MHGMFGMCADPIHPMHPTHPSSDGGHLFRKEIFDYIQESLDFAKFSAYIGSEVIGTKCYKKGVIVH